MRDPYFVRNVLESATLVVAPTPYAGLYSRAEASFVACIATKKTTACHGLECRELV